MHFPTCALALWVSVLAQEPPALRVTTRMMQMDVVVTDTKGRPVEGLTQDDFTVTENGKPQKIAAFAVEDLRKAPATSIALPEGIFTNRADLRGGTRSNVTVILFDLLNMRLADRVPCREELVRFLREQIRPEDRVAIYTLGASLRVLHEFTSDSRDLLKAAAREKPRGTAALDDFLAEGSDPDPTAGREVMHIPPFDRVKLTMGAMEAIANRVSGMAGRKNLIWISTGFPVSTIDLNNASTAGRIPSGPEYRTFVPEIQRVARTMNTSGLFIYSIDGQGVVPPTANGKLPAWFFSKRETMRLLSERTGGRAFLDVNDIAGAMRSAVEDARFTYVLGYYPSHGQWDGHYQEVKVKVNRRGTVARNRPGYLALADSANLPDREAGLAAAIASPLEQTGIRMVVGASLNMPARGRLTLRLTLDPSDVALAEENGRRRGLLDVAYVQQAGPDKSAEIARDRFNFDFPPEMYAKILEKGLIIEKELTMAASGYHLKVVARAVKTGAAGSVEIRTRSGVE